MTNYYIEIISQFTVNGTNPSCRVYHTALRGMDTINAFGEFIITIPLVHFQIAPEWDKAKKSANFTPLQNDIVRIYCGNDTSTMELYFAGYISVKPEISQDKILTITVDHLGMVGRRKTAASVFLNPTSDATDYDMIDFITSKAIAASAIISVKAEYTTDAEDKLKKSRTGLYYRNNNTVRDLRSRILQQKNLFLFSKFKAENSKTSVLLKYSNIFRIDNGSEPYIQIDIKQHDITNYQDQNNIIANNEVPMALIYFFTLRSKKNNGQSIRFDILSDIFFNLAGQEEFFQITHSRINASQQFEASEWEEIENAISNATSRKSVTQYLAKIKTKLNALAYSKTLDNIGRSSLLTIRLQTTALIEDKYFDYKQAKRQDIEKTWKAGLRVKITIDDLNIQNQTMLISRVEVVSNPNEQYISLNLISDISVIAEKDLTLLNTLNPRVKKEGITLEPSLLDLSTTEKIESFHHSLNNAISGVISDVRSNSSSSEYASQIKILNSHDILDTNSYYSKLPI
jgi:hypothetical protein